MRISPPRYQLQRVGEIVSDREFVIITLKDLSSIWEMLISNISNKNICLSFDDIVGKIAQKESRIISRGRIQKK